MFVNNPGHKTLMSVMRIYGKKKTNFKKRLQNRWTFFFFFFFFFTKFFSLVICKDR